eukprot:SAG11_NODE_1207_length_5524_cov_2.959447_3_plen_94_part_00
MENEECAVETRTLQQLATSRTNCEQWACRVQVHAENHFVFRQVHFSIRLHFQPRRCWRDVAISAARLQLPAPAVLNLNLALVSINTHNSLQCQ